jgi:hypothetical protein
MFTVVSAAAAAAAAAAARYAVCHSLSVSRLARPMLSLNTLGYIT